MTGSVNSFARKATLLAGCILLLSLDRATADASNSAGLSARIDIVERTIYEGQLFHAVLTIYSDGRELGDVFQLSALADQATVSAEGYSELAGGRELRDGREIDVRRFEYRLRTWATGHLQLSPSLKGQVVLRPAPGDMRGMTRVMMVDIPVEPARLQVLALPEEGRPPDFSGAVGKMTYRAELSATEATVGDLIRLISTVSGDADCARIIPPTLARRPGYKTYQPSSLDVPSRRGVTVFEQIIIPISESLTEIPSLRLAYFDPVVGVYTAAVFGPFAISVGPDDSLMPLPPAPEELSPKPAEPSQTDQLPSSSIGWPLVAALCLVVIAIVSLFFILRSGSRPTAPPSSEPVTAAPADSVSPSPLLEADALLDRNELIKAAGILLDLASDYVTKCIDDESVSTSGRQVDDTFIKRLRSEMVRCERIRSGIASDLSVEDQKLDLSRLRKMLEVFEQAGGE